MSGDAVEPGSPVARKGGAAAFRSELAPQRLRVSEAARTELGRIFQGREDDSIVAVRLYVTGAGCSGMGYAMTFTDRQLEHDRVLRCESFDIFVDGIAFGYLDGAEIDFERRETGDSFVFHDLFKATQGSGLCGGCAGAIDA